MFTQFTTCNIFAALDCCETQTCRNGGLGWQNRHQVQELICESSSFVWHLDSSCGLGWGPLKSLHRL